MTSANFSQLISSALADPSLRGKILYFPEKIVEDYELSGAEAQCVLLGDASNLKIDDLELRTKTDLVFNTHDLHSGE